jgi:hypothetical protein
MSTEGQKLFHTKSKLYFGFRNLTKKTEGQRLAKRNLTRLWHWCSCRPHHDSLHLAMPKTLDIREDGQ